MLCAQARRVTFATAFGAVTDRDAGAQAKQERRDGDQANEDGWHARP
jgi:hypothetical protein